jgi:hypothetical protein
MYSNKQEALDKFTRVRLNLDIRWSHGASRLLEPVGHLSHRANHRKEMYLRIMQKHSEVRTT